MVPSAYSDCTASEHIVRCACVSVVRVGLRTRRGCLGLEPLPSDAPTGAGGGGVWAKKRLYFWRKACQESRACICFVFK